MGGKEAVAKTQLCVIEPGGKLELREYDLPDWGSVPEEPVPVAEVRAGYFWAEAVNSPTAQAYVYMRGLPHETLPYAYFCFRGVEYFATELSYSTGMRRYLELLALAHAVARVEAWEGHNVLQD